MNFPLGSRPITHGSLPYTQVIATLLIMWTEGKGVHVNGRIQEVQRIPYEQKKTIE